MFNNAALLTSSVHSTQNSVFLYGTTRALSTLICFCLNQRIYIHFFSSLAYRPHVSGESGHRKRIFSKTFSSVEIFGKAASRLCVDGRKAKVSNAMMSSHHILLASRMLRKGSYRIPFISACENDSNFFLRTEKKISVFKNIWIRVDGA